MTSTNKEMVSGVSAEFQETFFQPVVVMHREHGYLAIWKGCYIMFLDYNVHYWPFHIFTGFSEECLQQEHFEKSYQILGYL